MSLHLSIVTICASLVRVSQQSIAGLTYMDEMDFEARYRNPYECDPLYWHPLHLPPKCAKMYEKLIRSRLSAYGPLTVYTPKNDDYNLKSYGLNSGFYEVQNDPSAGFYEVQNDPSAGFYEVQNDPSAGFYGVPEQKFNVKDYVEEYINYLRILRAAQPRFVDMLDALRQDVLKEPSEPRIEMMPNIGLAAVYRQPISRKSEDIIKEVAMEYGQAGADSYVNAGLFNENSTATEDKNNIHKAKGIKVDNHVNGTSRTHYDLKVYPGIGGQSEILPLKKKLSLEKSLQSSSRRKRLRTKKIVKGDTTYYITDKRGKR